MQDEGSAMITKELFDLSGKVALITGGSRGLGSLQMAEALGDMGARVAISARKQNELDTASSYLTAKGIDVLINNAGMVWGGVAIDLTPEN
jgi:NAD(P)-dependent dehydrogenase (short-subunit alcohol dehydrogenase family)